MSDIDVAISQLEGVISELPEDHQKAVYAAMQIIDAEVEKLGDAGEIALSYCTMRWLKKQT